MVGQRGEGGWLRGCGRGTGIDTRGGIVDVGGRADAGVGLLRGNRRGRRA